MVGPTSPPSLGCNLIDLAAARARRDRHNAAEQSRSLNDTHASPEINPSEFLRVINELTLRWRAGGSGDFDVSAAPEKVQLGRRSDGK